MPKILIIEDEDYIRENIGEILRAENFIVVEAENGQIGVQLALEEKPDLIICDVMMPELDGYGVLGTLRTESSTQMIPFIFLTAKTTREDLRLGMDLGADDYLSKPFTRNELLGAIATRLAKKTIAERESDKKLDQLRLSITRALPNEFRNPLNGILGLSKLLMEDYDAIDREEALDILEKIYVSGESLYKLTQNFLLYAELLRIGNDPERVRALRRLNEKTATKNIITQIARQKAEKCCRKDDLILELQEVEIPISQSKIKKIVEELIDNAFKFSFLGTPVQITTTCKDDTFNLFILDRGMGMTAEQINHLGAYMQFDREVYDQQGFGLGLATAKLLLELHSSKLSIESFPGQTIVHVAIPLESLNSDFNQSSFSTSLS